MAEPPPPPFKDVGTIRLAKGRVNLKFLEFLLTIEFYPGKLFLHSKMNRKLE